MAGMEWLGTLVGVNGATIVRGERGGDVGGVVLEDIEDMDGSDAESGLQESLRRQLYKMKGNDKYSSMKI